MEQLGKSKTSVIIKSLLNSPLGYASKCFCVTVSIISVFYFWYKINLYLLQEEILPILEENISCEKEALKWMSIEIVVLIMSGLLISLIYLLLKDFKNAFNQTKAQLKRDLDNHNLAVAAGEK